MTYLFRYCLNKIFFSALSFYYFTIQQRFREQSGQRGQLLIELLLAIGIAAILLPALVGSFVSSRQGEAQHKLRTQGTLLFRETVEAARGVRERDWTAFAVNGIYHPVITNGGWSFENGTETVGEFSRQITIDDVYRNSEGEIVETGGALDPSTKEVKVSVSWGSPMPSTVEETLYFTRHDNMSYTETTEEQFDEGFLDGVTVVNDEGGEVILGSGGSGDWCDPFESIVETLDLPKNGVANSIIASEGQAYVGTGENASGVSFADIQVSNENPPTANIVGDVGGHKTNAVFGSDNYGYIATDTNKEEFIIISTDSYSKTGYFNAPGNTDGLGVFTSGDVGFATTADNMFYTFDLSSKNGSRFVLDEVSLAGEGRKVVVVGNYAYVAVANSDSKIQVIDVGNPSNISIVSSTNFSAGNGVDVFVNESGTRAFLVTTQSSEYAELHILDATNKNVSFPRLGTYDVGSMNPTAVTVVPGNRAIVVGHGGEEYQVINIASEHSPSRCGGLDLNFNINGVQGVVEEDGDAYSYIITTESDSEFKVIEGGPGGGFSDEGIFESATYERPYSTAFNRFDVLFEKPSVTDVSFQIAIAEPESGDCLDAGFDFVGPDGDSETFFTDSAAIPFGVYGNYSNPGRCFRYKVFLNTDDQTTTPIFHEIILNHSP